MLVVVAQVARGSMGPLVKQDPPKLSISARVAGLTAVPRILSMSALFVWTPTHLMPSLGIGHERHAKLLRGHVLAILHQGNLVSDETTSGIANQ